MKKAQQTGVIVHERTPDEKPAEDKAEDQSDLESIASDLIKAVHAKDHKTVAMLLQEAYDCCSNPSDSQESNDYDSLNQQAASKGE